MKKYFYLKHPLLLPVLKVWGFLLSTVFYNAAVKSVHDEGGTFERLLYNGGFLMADSDTKEKGDNRLLNRVHRFVMHLCIAKLNSVPPVASYDQLIYFCK